MPLSSWFTIVSFTDGPRFKNAGQRVRTHSQRGGFVTKGETAGDVEIDEESFVPSSLRRHVRVLLLLALHFCIGLPIFVLYSTVFGQETILDREI